MSEHEHDWTPIQGDCGQYECTCGALGYRAGDGRIRKHYYVRLTPWTVKGRVPRGRGRRAP